MRVKVWHLYVVPVLLVGWSIYEFVDLTSWEAEGGVRRMNRVFAAIYRTGGKWAIVAVWLAAAGVWVFALVQYRRYARRVRVHEQEAHQRELRGEEAAPSAPTPRRRRATSKPAPVAVPAIPTATGHEERAPAVRSTEAHSGDDDEPSFLK